MNDLESFNALLKAPIIIDNDIWHCLIQRNKKSLKAIRHLTKLLQEIYQSLDSNRQEKIYFLTVNDLKIKRLKVEIELIKETSFFIKVSQEKDASVVI